MRREMQYYGTRLSENISRRDPEGYLLCLNVPVARCGIQDYLPEELGLSAGGGRVVHVFRPESEVFAPETIASFGFLRYRKKMNAISKRAEAQLSGSMCRMKCHTVTSACP